MAVVNLFELQEKANVPLWDRRPRPLPVKGHLWAIVDSGSRHISFEFNYRGEQPHGSDLGSHGAAHYIGSYTRKESEAAKARYETELWDIWEPIDEWRA